MDKKESIDRTVKNRDFDALIRFDQGNDFFQLRNVGRTENVQRRKINVTCQYSGDTRFKRMSPATVVVLIFASCFEKIYWIP